MRITLPRVKRVNGKWYVPAFPPHYSEDIGPYDKKDDAEDDREGVEETVNTPLWRMVLQEAREEEEEFERVWKARKEEVEEFEREWNSRKGDLK